MWTPSFECVLRADGEREYPVGHELVDEFLEFVSVRARPNTVKAYAHDLKVFFCVVDKDPVEVTPGDDDRAQVFTELLDGIDTDRWACFDDPSPDPAGSPV